MFVLKIIKFDAKLSPPDVAVEIVHVTHNLECDARLECLGSPLIILPSKSSTQCPQMQCKPFALSNKSWPKSHCYSTGAYYAGHAVHSAHLTSSGTYYTAHSTPRVHTAHTHIIVRPPSQSLNYYTSGSLPMPLTLRPHARWLLCSSRIKAGLLPSR